MNENIRHCRPHAKFPTFIGNFSLVNKHNYPSVYFFEIHKKDRLEAVKCSKDVLAHTMTL